MKILSIRKGFQGDHSSTSYEFFAVDKPLSRTECQKVASLSSRASPTKRKVSFIYHGDWSDLPGGWEPLMEKYYDVMYSESYDWWSLAMAFNTDQKAIEKIKKYEFSGICRDILPSLVVPSTSLAISVPNLSSISVKGIPQFSRTSWSRAAAMALVSS